MSRNALQTGLLEDTEVALASAKASLENNERQRLLQLEKNARALLKAQDMVPSPERINSLVKQMEQEEMQRLMNEAAARQEREPLLVGGQKKLDANKDGEISGEDFALLRERKAEGSMLTPREGYAFGKAFLEASKEVIKGLKELSTDNAQGAGITFSKTDLIKDYKTPEAFLDAYGDLSAFKKQADEYANELIDSGVDPKSVKKILTRDAEDLTEGEKSIQEKFLKKYFPKDESGRLLPKSDKPILIEFEKGREPKAEGSMMMPTEGMLVDTYPNIPEDEMDEALASQLPDDEMEEEYIDFIMDESLNEEEQNYLAGALQNDQMLSDILDKVITTASEFSGAGEVDGPGTGVSDSIPARLSDGEFVFTKKATDQMGAENLQRMMDDAERAYDEGAKRMAIGGMMDEDEEELGSMSQTRQEIEKLMMSSNQSPSLR
tara:strand:- start:330 stop:1637 length:1308 start_codon:yes stop_codon:yes gene_type:complete